MILHDTDTTATGSVEVRLGYLLAENAWGKGFASELIEGFVDWCRGQEAITSLAGGVEADNAASRRVLELVALSCFILATEALFMNLASRRFVAFARRMDNTGNSGPFIGWRTTTEPAPRVPIADSNSLLAPSPSAMTSTRPLTPTIIPRDITKS